MIIRISALDKVIGRGANDGGTQSFRVLSHQIIGYGFVLIPTKTRKPFHEGDWGDGS